ncbi:hypothetical protein [Nocardia miyunensis]|uniref:hypothetical protein n=1 Tax=Nocardia miyunensis TaxID=282684 RepID=UPI0008349C9B|nr:hypothetical protein [Nocardia miyunensis]
MSISHLVCQYCAHRNVGADSRCAHCGAPLADAPAPVAEPGHAILAGADKALHGTARLVRDAGHDVAEVQHAEAKTEKTVVSGLAALVDQWLAARSWKAALVLILAMGVLVVLVIRSCAPTAPTIGQLDSLDALPGLLRNAATCQHSDMPSPVDNCVVDSRNSLLMGGITGGAPLKFSVRVEQSDEIAQTIAGWRAAGPTVLASGSVFVAIGPSMTAWYADARSGLRIETSSFADRTSARSFLVRAGLIL